MLIENSSFHENIAESRETFLERTEVFPDGFLVLMVNGRVIGYISSELWEYSEDIDVRQFQLEHSIMDTHRSNGSELYISSIGILEEYRGSGYGKILVSELEKKMIYNYGINSIILIVSENWTAARRIYEKNGFERIQTISGFFHDDNNSDAIVMRKII
ncbi:GNAT family N-acetyltransferase [Methanolobus profundi]|nr:N-acetyltransferase [Methanolobus profundi]